MNITEKQKIIILDFLSDAEALDRLDGSGGDGDVPTWVINENLEAVYDPSNKVRPIIDHDRLRYYKKRWAEKAKDIILYVIDNYNDNET